MTWQYDPSSRTIESLERKVDELEGVVAVAQDTLESMRMFLNAMFDDADQTMYIEPEWVQALQDKISLALAGCKHKRI